MIFLIILLFIGIILIFIGGYSYYQASKIKIRKKEQQQIYQKNLKNTLEQLKKQVQIKQNCIQQKQNEFNLKINQFKKNMDNELRSFYKNRSDQLEKNFENEKTIIQKSIDEAYKNAQNNIHYYEQQTLKAQADAAQKKKQLLEKISKIQASIDAANEARKRQQEKKDKINFYKLNINEIQQKEINLLQNFKINFRNPILLNKLIWTQYFQKQVTELCNRIIGKKIVCGIYKITDLLTQQCYIGQSVNISDRIKQHCKCGLGIDAPASNKLYNTMQRDKLWNFTFEILEQCPREQLNQKEAFWIQMYKSNIYGLNTNKGVIK